MRLQRVGIDLPVREGPTRRIVARIDRICQPELRLTPLAPAGEGVEGERGIWKETVHDRARFFQGGRIGLRDCPGRTDRRSVDDRVDEPRGVRGDRPYPPGG